MSLLLFLFIVARMLRSVSTSGLYICKRETAGTVGNMTLIVPIVQTANLDR